MEENTERTGDETMPFSVLFSAESLCTSKTETLTPEVMMLFFYTMAFRWRPWIPLLYYLLLAKRCQIYLQMFS